MAGFGSIKELVEAEVSSGKVIETFYRKALTGVTSSGRWFDLSMQPGNPAAQYYAAAPMVSVSMRKSTDGGIIHGGGDASVAPSVKYLRGAMNLVTSATPLPMPMILCDYLMYYPFIDESITDIQNLTNSDELPRYNDGEGVQIMAVSVAPRVGGATFSVRYTNQDGVAGRTSQTVTMNAITANGNIITTEPSTAGYAGPFIPLQIGDTGVRSIETITMNSPDIGLFALVLVKPLFTTYVRGIDAPVEVDNLLNQSGMPIIYDDAYLNYICYPNGSLSGVTLMGSLKFTWT